jgi:AraC-like DNA-binding protein
MKLADELGIASAIVAPVVHALHDAGFDATQALPATAEALGQPFVSGELADALMEKAAAALAEPALGLLVARRIPIGALGMLDYALCTSARLREALERVSRHYGLATQRVTLELFDTQGVASLVLTRNPAVSHSRHWIEFSFALIAERIRQSTGEPVKFTEVTFTHDAPAKPSPYEAFFGVPVRFSEPQDALRFPVALLDHPLRTASAPLVDLLDERMREIDTSGDPFLARVRRAIVERFDAGEVDLAHAASRLRMSARTLQRELGRRGVSHRALVDFVRRERAFLLLADGDLSLSEVASRVGFREPSGFFRAFRRWAGTSPQAFRDARLRR